MENNIYINDGFPLFSVENYFFLETDIVKIYIMYILNLF